MSTERQARRRPRPRVVPTATYRLQLRPGFGFAEASVVAPYLARLGVSHVYSSPYLQAAPDSAHGYDVVDPHRVNRQLGGDPAHRRFSRALGQLDLGQVLDIVPNHMAIGPENPWWQDVLENGPSSRYARYFDVDWDPPESYLRNIVLVPILGDHYGRVLEAGEIRLTHERGTFRIRYHEHDLPVAPRSLDTLIEDAASRIDSDELAFIAHALAGLPPATAIDRRDVVRRHRDKEVLHDLLVRRVERDPAVAAAIDAAVAAVDGDPDALDALLARQNYRLAFWRAAGRDLGYRRFFDVTSLVGLRVEDDAVFADSHGLILKWLADGVLDGLRIDHPDGLYDPVTYLHRLREATPRGWLVVEKILRPGETLRADWPVDGSTGYDFLSLVGGLFIDPTAEAAFTTLYREVTGATADFAAVSLESRRQVLHESLGSDLNRLAGRFLEICEGNRRYRDFTRHELHEALREVAAAMPVYRTYIRADAGELTEADVAAVDRAITAATEARADLDPELFEFLGAILRLEVRGPSETDLVMRFQQLTGAVMAKGEEDTAFYRYLRLVSANEVGGDPARWSVSVAAFHAANAERAAHWPASMLTTSTHDTKRSEDVRARIGALSQFPDAWREAVGRWFLRNARHRLDGMPDPATEYLLYQTLVGAWPIEHDRLSAYLVKAAREAKERTSWTAPDEAFEAAVVGFATALLEDGVFIEDLEGFLEPVVRAGRLDALGGALLRLTSPGIPDTYQGTELWDLSLVDPDNRRPVDFGRRERLLRELEAGLDPEAIVARMDEGLPKLWVARQAMHLRRRRPEAFDARGGYEPLSPVGPRADHAVAFVRGGAVVPVVPRHGALLSDGWEGTTLPLPPGRWHDLLGMAEHDGGQRPLAELLDRFPLALLERVGDR